MILSTSSGVPLYEQIKNSIRLDVLSGKRAAGELLPSLRHLAAELRVSLITVTRAYNDLSAEGIVASEHGRGFVVLPVDILAARSALQDRQAETLTALVIAAQAARTPVATLHGLIDAEWKFREAESGPAPLLVISDQPRDQ